jgi:biotin synthase
VQTIKRFNLSREHVLGWLKETDPQQLEELFNWADEVRHENVGDAVHLRGLIEISNFCRCDCLYCGLRKSNTKLQRYRMSTDEILECAREAAKFGYGTVVLQSGETPDFSANEIADIIREIKHTTSLAATLSLGEQSREIYELWKQAGADRYLLRLETSDTELLRHIRPVSLYPSRINALRILKELGYETGSGIMVGIPGQMYASIANDIMLFTQLDLDMLGIGPYIRHPGTPLPYEVSNAGVEQVPATELGAINPEGGREAALQAGANVVMPNLTPLKYRRLYEIYPGKECIDESSDEYDKRIKAKIINIGRTIGMGAGSRVK